MPNQKGENSPSSDAHLRVVQPLLTDFYQLTMSYGYWKTKKSNEHAVFEVFFRKNPFQGEFTIFAGLSDCIDLLSSFKFSKEDIDYLRTAFPTCVDEAFFDYLAQVTPKDVSLWSVPDGTLVFPREPIMRVEGPIILCQLLETPILNSVNFASLIATNAARFRLAAGPDKKLFEFGLRRAQGPDGALSASKYAYLGGYDATSNVLAGKLFGIPVVGTHAHSFVCAYQAEPEMTFEQANSKGAPNAKLLDLTSSAFTLESLMSRAKYWLHQLSGLLDYSPYQAHRGELAAFVNYAYSFPTHFVGLIDTFDVLRSGLPNYCAVSLALHEYGYRAVGLRIDSGDLAFLSLSVRESFKTIATHFDLPWFEKMQILVSNDLNEDTLYSLNHQTLAESGHHTFQWGNAVDAFCVGTNLVTCQKQPALGCVYKLVEIAGAPTMKLSAAADKITLPGRKTVYRLFGKQGDALLDLIQRTSEAPPRANTRILCRHPSEPSKRVYVVPARVEEVMKLFWRNGEVITPLPTLEQSRQNVAQQMEFLRADYKRFLNPTPYKVSLSEELYNYTTDMWLRLVPIGELT